MSGSVTAVSSSAAPRSFFVSLQSAAHVVHRFVVRRMPEPPELASASIASGLLHEHREHAADRNRRPVREAAGARRRTNHPGASAGAATIRPVAASVAAQPPSSHRDERPRARRRRRAVNRNAFNTSAGPTMRADRGHQLHVAGSGGAEQVARQHQQRARRRIPSSRRRERDAARRRSPPGRCRPPPSRRSARSESAASAGR